MKVIPWISGRAVLVLLGALALAACGKRGSADAAEVPPSPSVVPGEVPVVISYAYEVVHTWPHDPGAFTQGLLVHDGDLLESTGLNGESTLRDVALESGKVLKKISVPAEYFAEGLAVMGSHAYQLTWQNHKGFIYDVSTFRLEGQFDFEGEGWGLTTDGQWLILSDGTAQIRFLDPVTFKVVRTLSVTEAGKPIERLNELEWVEGEIFANVWQTDDVVRIDPSSGAVRGVIHFSGLLSASDRRPGTDVLNGIAYDSVQHRLFVTGKRWPKIFEVRLKPQP